MLDSKKLQKGLIIKVITKHHKIPNDDKKEDHNTVLVMVLKCF